MFKNMKVGTKIIGGFIIALALTVIIGGVSIFNLYVLGDEVRRLATLEMPETSAVVETERTMWKTHVLSYEFDLHVDEKTRNEWFSEREKVVEAAEKIIPIARILNNQSSINAADEVKNQIDIYRKIGEEYAGLAMENNKIQRQMASVLASAQQEFKEFTATLQREIQGMVKDREWQRLEPAISRLDHGFLALRDGDEIERLMISYTTEPKKETADTIYKDIDELMFISRELFAGTRDSADLQKAETLRQGITQFKTLFDQWIVNRQNQTELLDRSDTLAMEIIDLTTRVAREADQDAYNYGIQLDHHARTVNRFLIGLLIGALILGAVLALFITRGITRPLNRVITGLNEGSDQVASASGQVSSASQSMAEGASEQAASIEETSSSMEEMASMTKQNAENAGNADGLMKDANQVVESASGSMEKLTRSMDEISRASEETSKIIKTIDEIAFQTNLLALNAAVEAARAGEAGAGFAVVADEVRNLAMRAADAAKNTAQLIEGTVKKVSDGAKLVSATNDEFVEVAQSVSKVGTLVSEITQASKEQSSGIDQVNVAISEMDKVVQQNAANAEESASASEELNAQALQLKDYVVELARMVSGQMNHNGNGKGNGQRLVGIGHADTARTLSPATRSDTSRNRKQPPAVRSGEVRADQMIPFDDDQDFKNF